ncbi:MAG TPA: hypothetical protein PLC74_13570 [Acetobacteraceae bacterium]|nr:hypothetical protein [Acetobacteraceae bacterium]
MSGTGTNPYTPQGTLNRVRVHVVIPSYPALNVIPGNMGTSFARVSFSGPFVEQIPTATGIVNSPEPYVMASVTFGILRTQSLANAWLLQIQATGVLGNVDVYSDTAAFPNITVTDTSVVDYDPGAFDGKDPIVGLTLRGVYYPNNNLWLAL